MNMLYNRYINIPEFLNSFIENSATTSFGYVLNDIISYGKSQVGNRKKILPLNVRFNGKEYNMEFNKSDGVYSIWRNIIETIWNKDYVRLYNTYYHPATSLRKSHLVEDLFNRIINIEFEDGFLNIKTDDPIKDNNDKIIESFKYYIDKDNQDQANIKNIKSDFSNYLEHINNDIDKVFHEIRLYYSKLLEFSDKLKLDKYIRIEVKLDKGTTYKTISNGNLPFATEIIEWVKMWLNRERDVIDIVPEIGKLDEDNFYSTNLLSFRFIYSDNHYAVKKYLNEKESEAISNYYASKKSGDYVGD